MLHGIIKTLEAQNQEPGESQPFKESHLKRD